MQICVHAADKLLATVTQVAVLCTFNAQQRVTPLYPICAVTIPEMTSVPVCTEVVAVKINIITRQADMQ
jgi:hypothetical protein